MPLPRLGLGGLLLWDLLLQCMLPGWKCEWLSFPDAAWDPRPAVLGLFRRRRGYVWTYVPVAMRTALLLLPAAELDPLQLAGQREPSPPPSSRSPTDHAIAPSPPLGTPTSTQHVALRVIILLTRQLLQAFLPHQILCSTSDSNVSRLSPEPRHSRRSINISGVQDSH